MRKTFGIILSSAGLLAGCGTNTISQNAKVVNDFTQSDIGTNLERLGCELSTRKPEGKQVEIMVKNCSAISNHDAITYIKDNLVKQGESPKPMIFFKRGR